MTTWQAHLADDYPALARDSRRLVLYRRLPEGQVEQVVAFDECGHAVVQTVDQGTAPEFRGFLIPHDALDALAELLKPGPSQGETARLEDALTVERRRVDDMLATFRGIK